jgi:multidrug efflux system membrane fusion protein
MSRSSMQVAASVGGVRLALVALLTLLALAGCTGSEPAQAKQAPSDDKGQARGPIVFPVEVDKVQARTVQYVISAVGSVDAYERVQVTARVAGVVDKVRFQEGDTVKANQVLAEIEPRRYQVAVRSAEAALARARVGKAEAEASIARRERAVQASPGLIPAEEIETFRAKRELAIAEELAAQASHDQASLNLRDAYVRATIGGTIETRNVQTGQYAQPGAVLATLVRRDPLLVRFSVPEQDAGKLKKGQSVELTVQGEPEPSHAVITHIAGLADMSTRMVPVTAEIAKDERDKLRPGAFAQVSIAVGSANEVAVLPEKAVRPSEKGFIAFVLDGDVARERVVTLGMHTKDGHVEVRSGIEVGEQLVVRGGEALRDGVKVKVEAAP